MKKSSPSYNYLNLLSFIKADSDVGATPSSCPE